MFAKASLMPLVFILVLSCGKNPFGGNSTDSSFAPSPNPPDTTAPSTPSSLNFTGNASFSVSPTLNWTASTDNILVSSYKVALGTTSGGTEISTFTDIGNVSSHQLTGLTLLTATLYYISIKSIDSSGNESTVATSSFYAPGLVLNSGAFNYPDSSFAISCLEYINSTFYNTEGDSLYWIDPDGAGADIAIQANCDMTRDGGGWTMIAQRRGDDVSVIDNSETCGASLNDFFQNTCPLVPPASFPLTNTDSYNIGDSTVRTNLISAGEWLFIQTNSGTPDTDDAYIIHHNFDLFPNSTGVVLRTAVTQVCDINNASCDSTGVEFLWSGDGFFTSANCGTGYSNTLPGNYGYCHNGNAAYDSNSLFGDRVTYAETKLWNHNGSSIAYVEHIYVR